jgi:uroporphyrin-III C-methyltransferase
MPSRLISLPEQPARVIFAKAVGGDQRQILVIRRVGLQVGARALGLKAIAEADFILYDALVDETPAGAGAQKGAGLIFAGKRAGVTSCKQSDISNLLVDLAKKGNRVLRLKGGDPFVFGRGGEEAGALAKARVPFRIVPGITAGIGGLAYAGIPVTHRDTNHAVTFITGHGADGKLPKLDWQAVGKGSETLVFYMARKFAGEIAEFA